MYKKAVDIIQKKLNIKTKTCVVLGSGFSKFADDISNKREISYSDIPGFPVSTVAGHSGKLICGDILDKEILVFSGRFHYYEGYSMPEIAFPIRVLKALGIENLILTNASGGVNTAYSAGDLVLINDHIKFFDESPLRGKNDDNFGVRFPDMTYAYDKKLIEVAKLVSRELDIELKEGVYAFMSGPSFETPAEIKMLRILGADMVGMSTVPETITAVHSGMKVLAISCVCNLAAGILEQPLTHEEVIAAGNAAAGKSVKLLSRIIERIV